MANRETFLTLTYGQCGAVLLFALYALGIYWPLFCWVGVVMTGVVVLKSWATL